MADERAELCFTRRYSITSPALASNVGGMAMPACMGRFEVENQFERGRLLRRNILRPRGMAPFHLLAGQV